MSKAKVIRLDYTLTTVGVLKILSEANIITLIENKSKTTAYVAGRGVNKKTIKHFMKHDEAVSDA